MIQKNNKPLHIIGFGGAGCNISIAIQKMGMKAKYTCISHPERENLASEIEFITFTPPGENRVTKTGNFYFIPDMNAPLQIPQTLYELFEPNAQYIIIAGLGGYTGTYLMQHFGSWLQEHQKSFTAINVLPFSFERKKTKTKIKKLKNKFNKYENFHFIELENYQKKYGNEPLEALFDKLNLDVYSLIKLDKNV